MICKKCSAEYDDNCLACPVCSQKNEAAVEDGFLDEEVCIVGGAEEFDEEDFDQYQYQQEDYKSHVYQPPERTDEEENDQPQINDDIKVRSIKPAKKRVRKAKSETISKEEKKIGMLLSLIMCLVGVIVAVLTVMRVKTDAFVQNTQPQQQTVALSKLSAQEEVLLEKELSRYYSVARIADFHKDTCTTEGFLVCINPADAGNIYSRVLGVTETLQTAGDPVGRFADENGDYAYYKVESGKIDKVLSCFGLTSDGNINCKGYYYYDGFYYFRASQVNNTPIVSVEITDSKKVFDGSFYAEFCFCLNNGTTEVKSDEYYVCVEKNSTVASGQNFIVREMSSTPIFDASGKLTTQSNIQYKNEKKVIEGKANDGTVFCRYTVEYPVLSGDSVGEKSVNSFLAGMLSSYEFKAAAAQKDYESFVSQGGKVSELPFTQTVVAKLSYSDNETISVVENISSYSPFLPEAEQEETTSEDEYYYGEVETQQEEENTVKLFDRSVEAYVFDRMTGEFIEKDDVLGKDYMLISEILYRIYNSYEYEALIPEKAEIPVTDENGIAVDVTDASQPTEESEEEYYDEYYSDDYYGSDYYDDSETDDGVPSDEYGIGTEIYESACCYTGSGFTFFYIEEGGYVTKVTIPLDVVERLAE